MTTIIEQPQTSIDTQLASRDKGRAIRTRELQNSVAVKMGRGDDFVTHVSTR